MEFIKNQFTRISEQLSGLSATQKMLTASLLAIMIMTLVWWSRYAGDPELTPLLNQSMSQEDIGQITASLDAKDIPHSVVGDKIMVPKDKQMEILAELGYAGELPKDFGAGFDDIIKQEDSSNSIFFSPDQQDHRYLEVKERELAMVIRNFPGVSSAMVVIDPTTERSMSGNTVQPSAMVTLVTMHTDRPSLRQLAESSANVICGAQAGLTRGRINVVIDGASYVVKDTDDLSFGQNGTEYVDTLRADEEKYADQIRALFAEIPGLSVTVSVKLNNTVTQQVQTVYDKKNMISVPIETKTEESSTTNPPPAASQDPGAVPNIVPNSPVNAAASSGGGTTTNNESDTMQPFPSSTNTTTQTPPGDAIPVAATVRVPRSYLIDAYHKVNNRDPDEAALATFTTQQLNDIRTSVEKAINIASDDMVFVSSYIDTTPVVSPGGPGPTTGSTTMAAAAIGSHFKEIAVGLLAAISLFMMSMMVKKGAAVSTVAAPVEEDDEGTLDGGQRVVGQVSEGKAALDGVELDEESVKAQQMVDQVQEMVTNDPDAAANLVKRWLNRS